MQKNLWIIGLSIIMFSGFAQAQNRVLSIPAQDLPGALHSLSNQTGIQVLFTAEQLKNIQSPAIHGPISAEQALNRLLQGVTSHTWTVSGRDTYVIKSAAEMATVMPEVTVTSPPDPDSPYSTQYNVSDTTTATKTKTPIMETPMSIQVVPKSVMNDQQAITLGQALNNVSGVFSGQGSNLYEQYNIRGFNTWDFYRGGTRFKSVYTASGPREVANLERIEVLKGPASILFGRIEPGGMVNLVAKKPQAMPYYSLQQQFGSYNLFRTTLDATSSLNQDNSLLYRLNFAYEDKGSFRDFVDNHHFFVAPVLQWRISDRTQVTLEMEYKTGKTVVDLGIPAIGNRPAKLPRERFLSEPPNRAEFEEILAGFNWSHAFNDQWEIKHRFYSQFTEENDDVVQLLALQANNRTLNRLYNGFKDNKNNTYTTNLDLVGHIDTRGIRHTLLIGGDYNYYKNTYGIYRSFLIPSIDIFNPVYTGSPIRDPAQDRFYDTREEWFGLYLQDQVKLPYDIHLLAGLRYDNAKIEQSLLVNSGRTFSESKQDRISPRIGVLWQPIESVSLYGNYVENFGLPNLSSLGINNQPLKAETAKQWEAGVKTELFGGRLSATLAWFHLTKNNMATPHPDPVLAAQGFSVVTGEVRNKGIELDITGELLPGWNIIANYTHIDSEITRANDMTEGNRLFHVPKHAGNIWSTYTFQNETLRGLKIGGGVTLRGKREGNLQNNYQLPGYAVFNLMTSYGMKLGKTRVTAQLNVNNLFNEKYFPGSSGFGRARIVVGEPRVFLGSLRVEY